MAVRDYRHRPFSLMLAEEETTVLYTAIPNKLKERCEEKPKLWGCVISIISNKRVVCWYVPGTHWAQRAPPMELGHAPLGRGGRLSSITEASGIFSSGTCGWRSALAIKIHRNTPVEMAKRMPFKNAIFKQKTSGYLNEHLGAKNKHFSNN